MDVVTGATGHVGNNLVRELLARGREVRVVVYEPSSRALRGLDVEVVHGDVRDIDSLHIAFKGAERVFHLGALISILGARGGLVPGTNVEGAGNAAMAALQAGVRRFIHMSSVHAFCQEPLDQAVDEDRTHVPQRRSHPAYDRSKAAGVARVREVASLGLDTVVLFPSGVVGPRDFQPSRMGRVLLAMYRGALPSLVAGGFDWVDVRDLVRGTISAAELGKAGGSYILSGHWHSMAELAEMVRILPGARPARPEIPMWLARLGGPAMDLYGRLSGREPLYTSESLRALRANGDLCRDRARHELGYEARPMTETIRDLFAWFAEEKVIPEVARHG